MSTELETPPAETKQSFTQRMAASRPKSEVELKLQQAQSGASGDEKAKTEAVGTPKPAGDGSTPGVQPAGGGAQSTPAGDAPKKDAPVAAATPDPDEEILSGKRSPKSDDFKRVKTARDQAVKERDEFKGKYSEYEKELTELRKRPVHNAEIIKKIEQERDEFKGKYEAFIVQFTPEFQAKFDNQKAQVIETLKTSIPEAEAKKLAELMELPNNEAKRKAIQEITDQFDQFQVAEVVAANREIQRIEKERKDSIANANKTLAGIGEERRKQSEESQAKLAKAFEENAAKVQQGLTVYQKRDGDEAWNKGVEEGLAVARKIFSGEIDADDKAQAALMAAAAPRILESYKRDVAAKDQEIATLKETVAKLQGASPSLETTTPAPEGGKKMTFTERMAKNSL